MDARECLYDAKKGDEVMENLGDAFNEMATVTMGQYLAAVTHREQTEAKEREHRLAFLYRHNPEDQLRALQEKERLGIAIEAERQAKRNLEETYRQVEVWRSELADELSKRRLAHLSDYDSKVVGMLQSGLLDARDLEMLYEEAESAFMRRLIGRHAEEMGGKLSDAVERQDTRGFHGSLGELRAERQRLAVLARRAREEFSDVPALRAYDSLTGIWKRCVKSPEAMWRHWEALTGELIETLNGEADDE